MAAMRRFTEKEFIAELGKYGCSEYEGFVNPDAIGKFMKSPSGNPFQTPEPDEEGLNVFVRSLEKHVSVPIPTLGGNANENT
jgi:hypothetical protein